MRIGQNIIVIGRIRSQPHNILKRLQNILKVVITTQIEKSALPVKSHLPDCINKEANASFVHTVTCSSEHKSRAAVGEEEERERERHTSWRGLFVFV